MKYMREVKDDGSILIHFTLEKYILGVSILYDATWVRITTPKII